MRKRVAGERWPTIARQEEAIAKEGIVERPS